MDTPSGLDDIEVGTGGGLCSKGCGFPAAPGKDRRGLPLVTCCRGCAQGRSHDVSCPGIVGASAASPSPAVIGASSGATAGVADRICIQGCGLPAAQGIDRKGRPFKTCCPGCAQGKPHTPYCGLSQEECDALARDRKKKRWRERRRKVKRVFLYVYDPLWGEIELTHMKEGDKFGKRQKLAYAGFTICPCLMVSFGCFKSEVHKGLSKAEIRKAWRRLFMSGSAIFSLAMVILMVAQVCIYGHAPYSENPMIGPPVSSFDEYGARNAARILYDNEWWRLVTPIFLHGGWLHILGNLAVQLRTGLVLECLWGTPIYLAIYLLSGIYASLASSIFLPNSLGVGASGSLCGIIGAWVPFILTTWNQTLPTDKEKRNAELVIVIVAICILIPLSFAPMTDFAAHLGGLAMGVGLSATIFAGRLQTTSYRIATRVAGLILSIGLASFSAWWFKTQVHPIKALLDL